MAVMTYREAQRNNTADAAATQYSAGQFATAGNRIEFSNLCGDAGPVGAVYYSFNAGDGAAGSATLTFYAQETRWAVLVLAKQ